MLLAALGEPLRAAIDNLDRAERLGYLASVEDWMSARKLRNQMVHEYVEAPEVLANPLQMGHQRVEMLTEVAERMAGEMGKRGGMKERQLIVVCPLFPRVALRASVKSLDKLLIRYSLHVGEAEQTG